MPRPVIHSRDHEHGGADPVRILWESDGSGSGGLVGATANFAGLTNTRTITNGANYDWPWDNYAGDATLLDLTAPAAPIVDVGGIYAFAVSVACTTAMSAGGGFKTTLYTNQGAGFTVQAFTGHYYQSATTVPTSVPAVTAFTFVWPCPTGSGLILRTLNSDGSASRNFNMFCDILRIG